MRRFGSMLNVNMRNASEKKYAGSVMPIYGPPRVSPLPPNLPLQYCSPKMHQQQLQHPLRPLVFQTYAEPMSLRDPYKVSPLPSNGKFLNTNNDELEDDICCRGHLVVLWIILGVITVGVISGIILAATIN
jgi:hypothetical protein